MSSRIGKALKRMMIRKLLTADLVSMVEDRLERVFMEELRFRDFGESSRIQYPWKKIDGPERISIGKGFYAARGLFLGVYGGSPEGEPVIAIGDHVFVNFDGVITGINGIRIGNDVLMGPRVYISDHSHGEARAESLALPPISRPLHSKGPISIGDRVWIGCDATILPGVSIGEDCIVGANSVVTKSFPARSVLAGNPARLIRSLD